MAIENSRPRRFGLLLVPGFSHLAMAMVIEPLFIANWIAQRKLFAWSTLSTDGLAVTASSGIHAPVDFPLGTTEHFDVVLVVASFDTREAAADARVLKWLRWAERVGTEVGAIETGSEILAAAGMMDDQTAPVHWYNIEGMRGTLSGRECHRYALQPVIAPARLRRRECDPRYDDRAHCPHGRAGTGKRGRPASPVAEAPRQ